MTACKTRKNSKENNFLDTSITSQIDLSFQSVQVVKSKNHDSKKDNSDQKLDSFADQDFDDLYVLTFDESESRIIFLFFILFGVLTIFSFSFMTIIHLITLEELPVQAQPNIPSFKTKGSNRSHQYYKSKTEL